MKSAIELIEGLSRHYIFYVKSCGPACVLGILAFAILVVPFDIAACGFVFKTSIVMLGVVSALALFMAWRDYGADKQTNPYQSLRGGE